MPCIIHPVNDPFPLDMDGMAVQRQGNAIGVIITTFPENTEIVWFPEFRIELNASVP